MSKFVTLALEPRFNDEYGEYANLPVFNAHGDVVGYTGGEVPETGNPCEFYVMDEEGFPACHSASENAKLRELLQRALTSHNKMCTNRGTCAGCLLFNAKPFAPACPIVSVTRDARELSVEVD